MNTSRFITQSYTESLALRGPCIHFARCIESSAPRQNGLIGTLITCLCSSDRYMYAVLTVPLTQLHIRERFE